MLFGKKEDKGRLPDLPPIRASIGMPPAMDEHLRQMETNSLPSFPDSPMHNKFSELAIKDATGSSIGAKLPELPTAREINSTMEMEEWMPTDFKIQKVPEMRERDERIIIPMREPMPIVEGSGQASNDVFVKIEKFHTARKTLKDVAEKLEEIDELIKKIRETKIREEQEISGWENDVTAVKTRLADVLENIFEKA